MTSKADDVLVYAITGENGQPRLAWGGSVPIEEHTFQVHVLPGYTLRLVPVDIAKPDPRCPVIIGGERCGERAGHSGKHCWGNGD